MPSPAHAYLIYNIGSNVYSSHRLSIGSLLTRAMSLIIPGTPYGDARRQASRGSSYPGGLTPTETDRLRDRFEKFLPDITKSDAGNARRAAFGDSLPPGANWDPRSITKTGQALASGNYPSGGGGKTLYTQQRPYQPEFDSPDRQQYPVHRVLANRYWRLFYKLDPVVGTCIDLYSDLPWSEFKMTGPGVEGSILRAYEQMVEESELLSVLPMVTREFHVTGEAVPHNFFDDEKGYWTHIALHNPDQLEVIDAPFIKMDPILEFVPDDRLRNVLSSNHPQLRSVREQMPPELLAQLQARQNIPLSSVNATLIARKLHPYDTRGTSIFSRLWRVFMYEDAIFNASIQTARRHAGPLKVAKLGNPQTGWIPGPEHEAKLLQLLAQAELDPHAWLVYHYGIQFETVGTTDRMMTINREWEIIERIKLIALGISKSFLHGEVTYASAATGLQVFLQRLKALRTFIEHKWLINKFFLPVAEINGWIRRSPAEIQHRFRIKRSQKELLEEKRYIVPELVWEKSLDPAVDAALVNAMQALSGLGVKFSKTTMMATVGMSFEEETRKIAKEREFERQFLPKITAPGGGQDGGGGGGGMGPGGPPPDAGGGMDDGGGEGGDAPPPPAGGDAGPAAAPPAPEGASLKPTADADKNKKDDPTKVEELAAPQFDYADSKVLKSKIWRDNRYGNWHSDEVEGLVDALQTLDSNSALWTKLTGEPAFRHAVVADDHDAAFELVRDFLIKNKYPDSDIEELREILVAEHYLGEGPVDMLKQYEQELSDDGEDTFLSGVSNIDPNKKLNGDVTQRLLQARAKIR